MWNVGNYYIENGSRKLNLYLKMKKAKKTNERAVANSSIFKKRDEKKNVSRKRARFAMNDETLYHLHWVKYWHNFSSIILNAAKRDTKPSAVKHCNMYPCVSPARHFSSTKKSSSISLSLFFRFDFTTDRFNRSLFTSFAHFFRCLFALAFYSSACKMDASQRDPCRNYDYIA